MHVVRVSTKDELKELFRWIFFRREGEFHEVIEARLSFEETQSMLGIRDSDFAPGVEESTDEWYDIVDNLDASDLERVCLSDTCKLLRDFKPGTLVWCLEDDFGYSGTMDIRVFLYVDDEEASVARHLDWRAREQAEYEERLRLHKLWQN